MVRPARPSAPKSRASAREPEARPAPARPAKPAKGRLRDRRRRARKAVWITLLVLVLVLAAASLYALWLPQLRVQEVAANGPNADAVESIARQQLAGAYGFVIPRDSIFFFPQQDIREAALAQHPDIAAVSISRTSFSSIALTAVPRAKAFLWCGVSVDTAFAEGTCFEADSQGLIYSMAGSETDTASVASAGETASTTVATPVLNGDLRVFAPLDTELGEGQSPVGAHVVQAWAVPDALRFVRAIETLGVPVSSLALRGDEADLWLDGSTRITYVLGREASAATLAMSVIPTLDLTDGSIQYLDLRFNGKAYVKRYGE